MRSCRGKYVAINVHIKKEERSEIDDLTLYLTKLEKAQKAKPRARRKNNKVRAKVKNIQNRKTIARTKTKQNLGL